MFGTRSTALTDADSASSTGTVPHVELPRSELAAGLGIVDLLARTIRRSKGAAAAWSRQGADYVNNHASPRSSTRSRSKHLATETMLSCAVGKRILPGARQIAATRAALARAVSMQPDRLVGELAELVRLTKPCRQFSSNRWSASSS